MSYCHHAPELSGSLGELLAIALQELQNFIIAASKATCPEAKAHMLAQKAEEILRGEQRSPKVTDKLVVSSPAAFPTLQLVSANMQKAAPPHCWCALCCRRRSQAVLSHPGRHS